MSNSTDLLNDIDAIQEEFGLTFQLADPDAPVTTEQRTINNLFFALLEARHATAPGVRDEQKGEDDA